MGIGKNIRAALLDGVQRDIVGINPATASGTADRQAQRRKIAEYVRSIYDAGFDPMIMIESFIGCLAFLGDNLGISREQIADCIREVAVDPNRSLIFQPTEG